MQNRTMVGLWCVLLVGACGRPPETSEPVQSSSSTAVAEPVSQEPAKQWPAQRSPDETCQPLDFSKLAETGKAGDFGMKVQTLTDYARERGVHFGFAHLANQACARHDKCRTPVVPILCSNCLVDVWCNRFDCSEPKDVARQTPPWDECLRAVQTQPCEQLDQPISCQLLEDNNFEIRITDFVGKIPEDPWSQ